MSARSAASSPSRQFSSPRRDAIMRVLADGREHTVVDLLADPGLEGVSPENLRVYIHHLRRRGCPIVLLVGGQHAYRLLLIGEASTPDVCASKAKGHGHE